MHKSIERGFVEAFSHASSHLRIDSGLELRRVRPSRLDKSRSMCLKSVFGRMKDEAGLSVVVNGAMYERIQSASPSTTDGEALSIQVCVVNSRSCDGPATAVKG